MRQVISGNPPTLDQARAESALNRVRHCALSLVGEPVIYPKIPELLTYLYKEKKISTFIVTNGQFPEEALKLYDSMDKNPEHSRCITQFYCSVDAPSEQQLKHVGRPLFGDAWDRLRKTLTSMRDFEKVRTVTRLTILKGLEHEAEKYADILRLGMPDFVEVKGVTFAPQSFDKNNLTQANVPTHADIVEFAKILCDALGDEYALALEHHHSCGVLIAKKAKWWVSTKIDTTGLISQNHHMKMQQTPSDLEQSSGYWRTWIDFDKLEVATTENPLDWAAKTPRWSYFGSAERGLSPEDTPRRTGRRPDDKKPDECASCTAC